MCGSLPRRDMAASRARRGPWWRPASRAALHGDGTVGTSGRHPWRHPSRAPAVPIRSGGSGDAGGERVGRGGGAGGTARGADLVVDVGDVTLDGAHAEHELGGDLLIGAPARDEPQDL